MPRPTRNTIVLLTVVLVGPPRSPVCALRYKYWAVRNPAAMVAKKTMTRSWDLQGIEFQQALQLHLTECRASQVMSQ